MDPKVNLTDFPGPFPPINNRINTVDRGFYSCTLQQDHLTVDMAPKKLGEMELKELSKNALTARKDQKEAGNISVGSAEVDGQIDVKKEEPKEAQGPTIEVKVSLNFF